jgi:hypothetical protein
MTGEDFSTSVLDNHHHHHNRRQQTATSAAAAAATSSLSLFNATSLLHHSNSVDDGNLFNLNRFNENLSTLHKNNTNNNSNRNSNNYFNSIEPKNYF